MRIDNPILWVWSAVAWKLIMANATNNNTQTITGSNPVTSIEYILPTTAPTAWQVLSSTVPSGWVATLSWWDGGGWGWWGSFYEINIPNELVLDVDYHQWKFIYTNKEITVSNVAIALWNVGTGSWSISFNLYYSDWSTQGVDTTTPVALFNTAITINSWNASNTNIPDTAVVPIHRWLYAKITASTGTTLAVDSYIRIDFT